MPATQSGRSPWGPLLGLTLITVLAWWLWPAERSSRGEFQAPAPQGPAAAQLETETLQAPETPVQASGQREGQAPQPLRPAVFKPATSTPEQSSEAALRFVGRTLDVNGEPVPHVGLTLMSAAKAQLKSDANGHFELQMDADEGNAKLTASDELYVSLVSCRLKPATQANEQYVVVAPAVRWAGQVLDELGQPLADVDVAPQRWSQRNSGFPFPLDQAEYETSSSTTDASGRFDLPRVAWVEGYPLTFAKSGYAPQSLTLPALDRGDLSITLQEAEQDPILRGRVLLPDLSPAAGATVYFHHEQTNTDEFGRFELPLSTQQNYDSQAAEPLALAAGLAPYGTVVLEDFMGVLEAARPDLPQNLELILKDKSLSISGQVVNEKGMPLGGWTVGLRNGLALSRNRMPATTAESLAGSASVTSDFLGLFKLEGLIDREYQLWAYDDETLRSIRPAASFAAGAHGVKLVARDADCYAELRGVVVSLDGEPLAGVGVSGNLVTARSNNGSTSISSDGVRTDAEGRFVLENLGKHEVTLKVHGENMIPREFKLEELGDPLKLRLEATRRCHFRLFIGGVGSESQSVSFEDAEGRSLSIYSFQSNGWMSSSRTSVDPINPAVLAVSEAAVSVLVGRGDPVRHAIRLIPGEVSELRVQQ